MGTRKDLQKAAALLAKRALDSAGGASTESWRIAACCAHAARQTLLVLHATRQPRRRRTEARFDVFMRSIGCNKDAVIEFLRAEGVTPGMLDGMLRAVADHVPIVVVRGVTYAYAASLVGKLENRGADCNVMEAR